MKVVLDTNVMVRAMGRPGSPARAVFDSRLESPHTLIESAALLDELRRVSHYPHVQRMVDLPGDEIDERLENVSRISKLVDLPDALPRVVPHDPADDPIVATAVAGQADVLCTLDRHLRRPEVEAYCEQFGIRILTDVELLAELRQ